MKTKNLLFYLIIIAMNSCSSKKPVDTIIKNAVIYSVDSSFNIFESMVIHEGKILELGKTGNIEKKYSSGNILDMHSKSIYPGLIDPHCHFYGYGNGLREADLKGTKSMDEVLERLEIHSATHPDGWILGRGWDQNDWQVKEWPNNEKLNKLFPDRPVILIRIDGHAALVNQKAIDISGIKPATKIEGGEIIQKNGKLTGILVDNATNMVQSFIPKAGEEEIKEALLGAEKNCFAVGLTSVHDAGLDLNVIEMIDDLHLNQNLKIRIYAMLSPTEENFGKYMYHGIYKTERLHIASIKLYADGALGSRGALMIEPYSDDPKNSGLQVASYEYLHKMAALADSFGYQVNTHCIGDSANRLMLTIYKDILKTKNDKRWRIEHSQVIHPEDINLFGDFSIIPSIQTTHATSDMYWAEDRLGDRIQNAYTYKTLLNQNGWLPNGSDFPIEDINPLYGFFAAVTRMDHSGWPENGFQKEEALSREDALRAMTIWAAKAGFEENEIGSLEPGKKADFVVTDRDIMKVDEMEIFNTRVINTYISGEEVYASK
ncbi:MAG: amidohydrolase [Bacteroidales bacterium]|nr:amidohydrolase [Bacteroidales bacterium]MCF8391587.1 amidohydrolase [Bacteroidales bacterium]